jgi:hypothetical protein
MRVRVVPHPEEPMRIPTKILDCVGFIAAKMPRPDGGYDYDTAATGFCVEVGGHYGSRYFYFVTAAHVFSDTFPVEKSAILINKRGGGITEIPMIRGWHKHTDPSVDALVLPFDYTDEMDVLPVPEELFLRREWLGENSNIGVGSDVFCVGLFTVASGKTRNIPIVRFGNVAMLPDSAIQVEGGFSEVYLTEARSIGGISGSPVFVMESITFAANDSHGKERKAIGLGANCKLLGLMHGHWDITGGDLNKHRSDPRRDTVNMGIAVVVPAPKILEILASSAEFVGDAGFRDAWEVALEMSVSHTVSMDSRLLLTC